MGPLAPAAAHAGSGLDASLGLSLRRDGFQFGFWRARALEMSRLKVQMSVTS